jgi:hypothetical protein
MQTTTIGESVTRNWTDDSPPTTSTTAELVELILKDQRALDTTIRDDIQARDLIPRLLAVALVGFAIFGIAATLIVNLGGAQPSWMPRTNWSDGTWASLTGAYVLGLVASVGVCLPSFYFYGLLAGVKLSMLQAAAHSVKCMAVTAVVLVGVLPIYVAFSLGIIVFSAPVDWLLLAVNVGLALPFAAGLAGVRSLFVGFTALADTLPVCHSASRAYFLRRLTLAWSVCYTAVTPVMIFWLWTRFAG